jgi:dipeptidyl aminopeptidase/acylaminoacyl peptidase
VTLWLDKYGDRPGRPGRDQQANAPAAHKLQGKLLLIHGDMDENVHVGHTLALVDALVKAGKPFDSLVVPGATHGVTFESAYAMTRLLEYLAQALLQAAPARQYGPAYSQIDLGTAMQFLMSDMAWN